MPPTPPPSKRHIARKSLGGNFPNSTKQAQNGPAIRIVQDVRSFDFFDDEEVDDKVYQYYLEESGKYVFRWSEGKHEHKPTGPPPIDESLCPKAARYKLRASGRKITPPRFDQGDFEFMVDIDPEVDDSLGRNFYDEHGSSDNEFEPDEDYVHPSRMDHNGDLDERKYVAQALEMWTPAQRAYLRDLTRREGVPKIFDLYLSHWRIPVENLLLGYGVLLSKEDRQRSDKVLMLKLQAAIIRCMRSHSRLLFKTNNFKTPKHVTASLHGLMMQSKKIVVLSGAGISVSCGIPDFRSKDGLYAKLSESGVYNLDDPQQMFDINYFKQNPNVFYSFARDIYPSNFEPSICHKFIKALEDNGKLLRNYTQNIDTLEQKAGIKNVVQCHGSFATASCINCHVRVPGDEIKDDLLKTRVPLCKVCNDGKPKRARKKKRKSKSRNDGWESDDGGDQEYPKGIMKPDITFFGEKLCTTFDETFYKDLAEMDLLLIMGTSLRVSPVSDMISYIPQRVPIVVINKTAITHIEPEFQLLGDADYVVSDIAARMDYPQVGIHEALDEELRSGSDLYSFNNVKTSYFNWKHWNKGARPTVVGTSGVVLYHGAIKGSYVRKIEEEQEDLGAMRKDQTAKAAIRAKRVAEKRRVEIQVLHEGSAPSKRMRVDVAMTSVANSSSAIVVEH